MAKKTYLLTIDPVELDAVKRAIFVLCDAQNEQEIMELTDSFFDKLRERKNSEKTKKATASASAKRVTTAKNKIQNAINLLRLESKPITHYSIAKTANVSYNTVKKHFKQL